MQTNRPNSLLPSREDLINIVRMTLEEDVGSGDITAALIPAGRAATAKIIGRESGILCGTHYAEEVFSQIGLTSGSVAIDWLVGDGDEVKEGTVIASLSGSARSILTGERSALNILQTLSATATTSRHYARLVQHTKVKILDTRKTLPALRTAQKYAVRVGGCDNHRVGLFDAFLIKRIISPPVAAHRRRHSTQDLKQRFAGRNRSANVGRVRRSHCRPRRYCHARQLRFNANHRGGKTHGGKSQTRSIRQHR